MKNSFNTRYELPVWLIVLLIEIPFIKKDLEFLSFIKSDLNYLSTFIMKNVLSFTIRAMYLIISIISAYILAGSTHIYIQGKINHNIIYTMLIEYSAFLAPWIVLIPCYLLACKLKIRSYFLWCIFFFWLVILFYICNNQPMHIYFYSYFYISLVLSILYNIPNLIIRFVGFIEDRIKETPITLFFMFIILIYNIYKFINSDIDPYAINYQLIITIYIVRVITLCLDGKFNFKSFFISTIIILLFFYTMSIFIPLIIIKLSSIEKTSMELIYYIQGRSRPYTNVGHVDPPNIFVAQCSMADTPQNKNIHQQYGVCVNRLFRHEALIAMPNESEITAMSRGLIELNYSSPNSPHFSSLSHAQKASFNKNVFLANYFNIAGIEVPRYTWVPGEPKVFGKYAILDMANSRSYGSYMDAIRIYHNTDKLKITAFAPQDIEFSDKLRESGHDKHLTLDKSTNIAIVAYPLTRYYLESYKC